MKKLMILLCFLTFSICCKAQLGTTDALEGKGGYKGILLGSDIAAIKSKLFSIEGNASPDADSCVTFEYRDAEALKITESTSLMQIGIRTYKNKIQSIILLFNKSDGPELSVLFIKAFGLPLRDNQFMDIYKWSSSNVGLSLNYENNPGYAIYTCKPIQDLIDKNKLTATNKAVTKL